MAIFQYRLAEAEASALEAEQVDATYGDIAPQFNRVDRLFGRATH